MKNSNNIPLQTFPTPTLRSAPVGPEPARYALKKGLGYWELIFNGQHAVFKHEQGAYYVAYLLLNPPDEPIHGLALSLRVNALYGRPVAVNEIIDPVTGGSAAPGIDARLDERGLALDDAEEAAGLRRTLLQLEAIVDDESTSDPVREEVQRELQTIYAFQKKNPSRTTDAAQKAIRTVRMAIKRFHQHLAGAVDASQNSDPVLRSFSDHIKNHIIIPSARYSAKRNALARAGLAGCFTYEPPLGVMWVA